MAHVLLSSSSSRLAHEHLCSAWMLKAKAYLEMPGMQRVVKLQHLLLYLPRQEHGCAAELMTGLRGKRFSPLAMTSNLAATREGSGLCIPRQARPGRRCSCLLDRGLTSPQGCAFQHSPVLGSPLDHRSINNGHLCKVQDSRVSLINESDVAYHPLLARLAKSISLTDVDGDCCSRSESSDYNKWR